MSSNNITTVLVPGTRADGSSRAKTTGQFQSMRSGEVTAPIALTSHAEDLAALERTLKTPSRMELDLHGNKPSADRLGAFSDAVIAVVITIMVLELKAPESPAWSALWPLWPTAVSYAVSYLFIAIVWVNHHHLLRFVRNATPRLIWTNFAHLFAVSLVPFSTAWIARTELAAAPVALYAAVFVFVNVAYCLFERDVLQQADDASIDARCKHLARRRSVGTLLTFVIAAAISLLLPRLGFVLVCMTLILYLRPEAPGSALHGTHSD